MALKYFILNCLRYHKRYMFGFFLLTLLASVEASLGPYALKLIIDTVTEYNNEPEKFYTAMQIPAMLYIGLTVLHNFLMRCWNFLTLKFYPRLRTEVATRLFEHLSQHSQTFFQQNFSGNLASKVSDVAEGVGTIVDMTNYLIIARFVTILVATTLLAKVHILFSIILLIWVIAYVGNGYRLAARTAGFARTFSESISHLSGKIVDSIANIVSVKIFSNNSYETKRIVSSLQDVADKDRALQWHMLTSHFQQNTIFTIFVSGLLVGLIYGYQRNLVTAGDFAFVLSIANVIYNLVNALTQAMPTLAKEAGKCQQALRIIMAPHDMQDLPDAKTLIVTNGKIEFQQVCFGYSINRSLFNNINLVIPGGQKIGLVGYSGGGKSSLVNLILRLYPIDRGSILIDGQDINHIVNPPC